MTVDQLRELLAPIPGHLRVHVEVPIGRSEVGADVEYRPVDDVAIDGIPHQGRFLAIRLSGDVL